MAARGTGCKFDFRLSYYPWALESCPLQRRGSPGFWKRGLKGGMGHFGSWQWRWIPSPTIPPTAGKYSREHLSEWGNWACRNAKAIVILATESKKEMTRASCWTPAPCSDTVSETRTRCQKGKTGRHTSHAFQNCLSACDFQLAFQSIQRASSQVVKNVLEQMTMITVKQNGGVSPLPRVQMVAWPFLFF